MEVPRPRSLSNRPTSTHIPDGPRLPFSWQQRGDTEAVAGTNNRKRLKYDSTFKGSRSRPPGSQTPHGIESAAKPQCSEWESCHDVSKNTNSIEVRHALSDRQFCNAYDRDEARPVFGSRPQVRMVVRPDVQREERTHVQEHKYSHADKYDKNSTKRVSFLGLQREEQKSDHADRHGKPFTEHISINDLQRTHVQEQKSDHAKRYGKPSTKHVPIHDLQREERTRVQERKSDNEDRYPKPFTKHVSFLEEHHTEAQTTRSTSDKFAVKLGKCSASGSIHKKGRSDADSIPPNSQKPVPILKTVNHLDLPEIPFEAQIATTETVTYTELSALAHCLIYITMTAVNVVMLWSMLSCLANLA